MPSKKPLRDFFRVFYETGRGLIVGLASPEDSIRDGLGLAQVARLFPIPDYPGIVVEPGRPNIPPVENMICLGSSMLLIDPDAFPVRGGKPLSLPRPLAGLRLQKIRKESCFHLESLHGDTRGVINSVTRDEYLPRVEVGEQHDYGVINRVFRGPMENTVVLEGVHRLGTLGTVKVATDPAMLEAILGAAHEIDGFDETRPLEILVKTIFCPQSEDDLITLAGIQAVPLAIVYDRRWINVMGGGRGWEDQLPWDVHVRAQGENGSYPVASGEPSPVPRLELSADLSKAAAADRKLCRKVFLGDGQIRDAERERLLGLLSSAEFRLEVIENFGMSHRVRITELPQRSSKIRRDRKQFLVHLALCRLLDLPFQPDSGSIREYFSRFAGRESGKTLERKFVSSLRGRIHDGGFQALLGTVEKPKNFVGIDRNRDRGYELRLDQAVLDMKVRFKAM